MKFLEQLQALDDTTKKKVLVAATAVIMVIVIYFWLAYFNNLVTGIASQSATPQVATAPQQAPAVATSTGESFWEWISNLFSSPRQYNIQPQ